MIAFASGASAIAATTEPSANDAMVETRTGRFDASFPVLPEYESSKLVALACSRNNHLVLPAATRAELWKWAGEQEAEQEMQAGGAHVALPSDKEDPPGYQVYVPADYAPGKLFGLLVWNSPSPRGDIPAQFKAVCDHDHLIWIGAANVGNNRNSAWRIYMPLEVATQARRRFTIDPQRVYVSGASGGGRVSSRVAIFFPDTFTGGVYIIGCDYYRNVPASNHPHQSWSGFWLTPDPKLLTRAKTESRVVILEGSKDPNLDDAKDFYAAYQKDNFKHLTYLEVPGMGHMVPPGEWFEKAVTALDQPLAAPDALEEQAKGFEKLNEVGDTYKANARLALRDPASARGQAAQQKADAIYRDFAGRVAEIRAELHGASPAQASSALAALHVKFGVLVSDLAPDLDEAMRAARAVKGK